MALLAESVVEEWLTRQGYFTIRGLKQGNDEIDILAVKLEKGKWRNLHVEVQVSIKPVSYISGLSKSLQMEFNIFGSRNAKKRDPKQLKRAVDEWVGKKFLSKKKASLRKRLTEQDKWDYLFVHGIVKEGDELKYIAEHNIELKTITQILKDLQKNKFDYTTGSASDLIDLIRHSK